MRMMLVALLTGLPILFNCPISLTDEAPATGRSSFSTGEPVAVVSASAGVVKVTDRHPTSPTDTILDSDGVVRIGPETQATLLLMAKIDCLQHLQQLQGGSTDNNKSTEAKSCPRVWDGISCWPETPAGQSVAQPCPPYINNFRINALASRRCQDDGRWFFHATHNRSWTNYTLCGTDIAKQDRNPTPLLTRNLPIIQLISNTGYSLSLVVLLLAVIVMLYFRKLRCPRNTLHLNLFASFILRASMALARDFLLTEGIGMTKDVLVHDTGRRTFDSNAAHWECRLLMTSFNYALMANYSWIFVEGLYLHTLLFLAVFSESSSVVGYIAFGWVAPFVCVLPWAIVRLTVENDLCWNTHPTPGIFWIIKGPVIVTIILNFCFFLNIVRVLFTKLQAFNSPDSRKYRHRKLAKSALVLIPLFGVPYVIFLGWQENINETIEVVKLYFEMTFNSFNGVIVAMLYCFLNGEVQAEMRKKWASSGCRSSTGGHGRLHHGGGFSMSSRRATMTSNIYATRGGESQTGNSSFRMGNSSADLDDQSFRMGNSTLDADDQSADAAQFKTVLNDRCCYDESSSSEKMESVPLRRMDDAVVAAAAAATTTDSLASDVQVIPSNSWKPGGEGDDGEWKRRSKKKSMTPAIVLNL